MGIIDLEEDTPPNHIADEPVIGIPEIEREPLSRDNKKLATNLGEYYQLGGIAITQFGLKIGDEAVSLTGVNFVNSSEEISEAWVRLGEKNPKVKAALKKFTEYSALGTVVAVHIAAFSPILISRGILPDLAGMTGQSAPDAPPVNMNGNGAPIG